jgi:hypothetical protein
MIISMQGNWVVSVKAKNAAYPQRFIVSGASSGNGTYIGTAGTTAYVVGNQWSIAIQNNPGSGFQLSDSMLKFPQRIGSRYEFEIWSNDAGGDSDFNDLILTCSTWVNVNDFMLFGNVSLYSGRCIFNPCRRLGPWVIETPGALLEALKNPKLRDILERDYPERIPENFPDPPFPDPPPFRPIVIDPFNEAMQPKTELLYQKVENTRKKAKNEVEEESAFSLNNFSLANSYQAEGFLEARRSLEDIKLAKLLEGLTYRRCNVEAGSNVTLTFEEYDRSASELAGGPYEGNGNRRILGDTVTDSFGNYIFRFSFDMTFPGLEDAADIAPGEDVNVIPYPDIIVKITEFEPYEILYESAPYYNIPNLKRIDLCLPKKRRPTSACFNGNLIGSLGNIFIGGNQNANASTDPDLLRRYGYGNHLESTGVITVGSSLAGFGIECAAWYGTIDFRGCMYDLAKTPAQNKIHYYTIRIKREGASNWQFVTQNYKHPKFHMRNTPGYIGDDVGPFTTGLKVDGGAKIDVPAYVNIQREIFADGVDWEFSQLDRYMRLNTNLYDRTLGEIDPGTFLVRVDGYEKNGNPVPNATDMIALFIHNKPLEFHMSAVKFVDSSVLYADCGLYRLTDAQMNLPIEFDFQAYDPEGFLHSFALTMGRCPAPMIGLSINQPAAGISPVGASVLYSGASTSVHDEGNPANACQGYTGTEDAFANAGLIHVELQPAPAEGGWIKPAEYFTRLGFHLQAFKRMTNGYNSGLSDDYNANRQILMERLNP